MSRFFVEPFSGDIAVITGQDAHHIARVLRMRVGENLLLCDGSGLDYGCRITAMTDGEVQAQVLYRIPTESEPTVSVTLYQGLPKSEKMDLIVQKCVEIGITRIVPVGMARSIVKLNAAEGAKKQARWQKIAASAAEQSGRGIIPEVAEPISFKQMLAAVQSEHTVTFYEGGGKPLSELVNSETNAVSLVIGPEGGFESEEIDRLREAGAHIATLGKRILRCETAPLVALSVVMQLTGNMN
ncbi:MAG: 16S rRNA (uracil(1498)-N(3))-methyltransferase [Clostridia bacterium]|nr:16S rRNA (uracil(1498)-N(3))-methyltransferase [Clostridia bacterium]